MTSNNTVVKCEPEINHNRGRFHLRCSIITCPSSPDFGLFNSVERLREYGAHHGHAGYTHPMAKIKGAGVSHPTGGSASPSPPPFSGYLESALVFTCYLVYGDREAARRSHFPVFEF